MASTLAHHEVFSRYDRWKGISQPGVQVDFLGVRIRESFFLPTPLEPGHRLLDAPFPAFDEEYFEWVSLLTAVKNASDSFTMVELGAGYGRWVVKAAAAVRRARGIPCRLVAVEAEPTHFRWMRTHFRDNDLAPRRHWLIEAAVSDRLGWVPFLVGDPNAHYGQAIVTERAATPPSRWQRLRSRMVRAADTPQQKTVTVPAITLDSILKKLESIDLIDADIQGSEAAVFEASADLVNRRVKAVHIGTHSDEQETRLRNLFTSLSWEPQYEFACNKQQATPFGAIKFGDGVQAWTNPRCQAA
jgi:FkbM family methyltransferase